MLRVIAGTVGGVVAGAVGASVVDRVTLFRSERDKRPEVTDDESEKLARLRAAEITGNLNGSAHLSDATIAGAVVKHSDRGVEMFVTNPLYLGPSSDGQHWLGYTSYTEAAPGDGRRMVTVVPFLNPGVPVDGSSLTTHSGVVVFDNPREPVVGYDHSTPDPYDVGTVYAVPS